MPQCSLPLTLAPPLLGTAYGDALGLLKLCLELVHVAMFALQLLQQRLQLLTGRIQQPRLPRLWRFKAVAHLLYKMLSPLALQDERRKGAREQWA